MLKKAWAVWLSNPELICVKHTPKIHFLLFRNKYYTPLAYVF